MHQAGFSKRWLGGDMLWTVFAYPFLQLGLGMVCGTIPSSKPELLDFNLRLGFNVECVVKGAYVDGDLIVMAMRREQCRWIKKQPKMLSRGSV
jgi:hypothetical protein